MSPDARRLSGRPGLVGTRTVVIGLVVLAGLWGVLALSLRADDLWPAEGGWRLAVRFFSHALQPALRHQAPELPDETPPLLLIAASAAVRTVAFAAAAMPLAILIGLVLGAGSATAWWAGDRDASLRDGWRRHPVAVSVSLICRLLAAMLRSVHELLWAVVLLAAVGVTPLAAVVALALPYGGTLAKVFGEMIDEAPREAAAALREAGALSSVVFAFARLPQAFADMAAYTLYRFECGLRSAAVLGFFGFPTLGYHLAASFENLYYGEVWTYLYVLLALVLVVDTWSGRVRGRLAA